MFSRTASRDILDIDRADVCSRRGQWGNTDNLVFTRVSVILQETRQVGDTLAVIKSEGTRAPVSYRDHGMWTCETISRVAENHDVTYSSPCNTYTTFSRVRQCVCRLHASENYKPNSNYRYGIMLLSRC